MHSIHYAATGHLPPAWSLRRPKPLLQAAYDFVGAPLRMTVLPDSTSERLGLTSLRAERFAAVLPALRGRCLDIGAGAGVLMSLYRQRGGAAADSVSIDTYDWSGMCVIVESSARLPFPDATFDTVSFVACLNHIPERGEAIKESYRLLRPGGRVVVTMISRWLGWVGHRLWWYSEDKIRVPAEGETDGLDPPEVIALIEAAGFTGIAVRRFVYGLNRLYVAERPNTT